MSAAASIAAMRTPRRPRLGFVGVGWIGRHRLQAVVSSGAADVVAIADPIPEARAAAAAVVGGTCAVTSLRELMDRDLDGVVIATPSAQHAEQAIAALERGVAVFCQKPLARDGAEAQAVVDAARKADRLLGLDLSYRHTRAMRCVRERVRGGGLGRVYAAQMVFHNAYGPDKPWFYDRQLSGGGAVMDLGIHLVDLALWVLDFPAVESVSGRLFSGGHRLAIGDPRVEDYASLQLELAGGAAVDVACSWRLPAGRECVITAAFYGTSGGAAMNNVNGSFYDFTAESFCGTQRQVLTTPPDPWGGRAVVEWVRRLSAGERFDPAAERFVTVARVLDRVYRGEDQ